MEAPGITDDEARDLFSAYHDGELSSEEHARVRAALDARPELAREYEAFASMLKGLSGLADAAPTPAHTPEDHTPKVDLLAGVQQRIHKRSGGRFYRDRWSRTVGIVPLEVVAVLVLIALVVAYFAMTSISIEPVREAPTTNAH
jgi:anti-sigma factor RsiW